MKALVLVLAIISLLIAPSLTDAVKYREDDPTLVLYFPFDEGEGDTATDASMFGNDGELDDPDWVDGKIGGALEFDGQDDVVIVETKNSDELQLLAGGTIECWFQLLGQGNSVWPRIFSKESTTSHHGGYCLRLNWSQKQQLELGMQGQALVFDNEDSNIKPNIWYHGAGTFTKDDHKVYLNGELVKEGAQGILPLDDRDNDLRIGGSFAGPRNFEGIVDEVRIWNRVLGQDEIKENMDLSWNDLLAVSPAGRLTTTWGRIKARLQ